jgi:hypothetical protein
MRIPSIDREMVLDISDISTEKFIWQLSSFIGRAGMHMPSVHYMYFSHRQAPKKNHGHSKRQLDSFPLYETIHSSWRDSNLKIEKWASPFKKYNEDRVNYINMTTLLLTKI